MSDDESRLHAKIAEACLAVSSDAATGRLALYRRLVRNNLTGVTEKMLARTRARLNALPDAPGLFEASFAAFLEARGPRTHYLRDVPHEFLAWAEGAWPTQPAVPAWALDLARHELVEYEVSAARARAPEDAPPADEIALDRALLFAEPVRLMRYAFAVHELPADLEDRTEPAARATTLLVYRDADDDARFLDFSPLAAAVTARLIDGAPLGLAVTGACTELGAARTDAVMTDVSRLLASLAERGILLGARPGPVRAPQ